jgi:hypothetical protein
MEAICAAMAANCSAIRGARRAVAAEIDASVAELLFRFADTG